MESPKDGKSGGEIHVSSELVAGFLVVHVRDTGCGIPPQNLAHIFEPLFTTKGERGTGIGLSVSRKIVENHNGRLSVQSEVGKGTVFSIALPISQKEGA
jgi:signal transduction histidine kinase